MRPHAATPDKIQPREDPIAGRYELVERIAQGGMGEVYAAREIATGQRLALKRLLPEHRKREPLFRMEYQALARLRHPYIIRVYEYGIHKGVPYYTMELLDGHDLREIPQASVRDACRYVRDVATSLALLHAHRLLHRDVSPRNVRLTSSGQCKLLDFGMMVPFGVPPNVAGTPPFVSPEAWDGAVLDQRSDLYSLGALAYWLITRKLPPDTRSGNHANSPFGDAPLRMRRSVPEVPEALDDLVMALLEVDPAKRPVSAAEVILRLNAIAELEPDDSIDIVQSYLSSARFVGRRSELASFEVALSDAADGQGSSLLVTGPAGVGRTRLLHEFALLAQARGFNVLHATSGRTATNATLAREIYRSLRRSAPAAFRSLEPRQQKLLEELEGQPKRPAGTAEMRASLQAALRAFFHRATAEGNWLLAIDDLDAADQFSAAFVASLTRDATSRQLLLVATATQLDEGTFSPTQSFANAATLITLSSLDVNETRSLASSLFGSVPHLERVVDWLYREARGHPGLTMELASWLLRRGTIRYVEGAFLLPQDPIDEAVPPDLAHASLLRIEGLSAAARKLVELLAVRRGNTSLELCLSAIELNQEDTLGALRELVSAGVLMSVRGEYAFVQEATRTGILASLAPERQVELHRRLAKALLRRSEPEHRLEAGWHLVHTEDELQGADVLAEVTPTMVEHGVAYTGAIRATEKALEVYERRRAPLAKRLAMRTVLMRAAYLYDYRLYLKYGEQTLTLLDDWLAGKFFRRVHKIFGSTITLPILMLFVWLKRLFLWGEKRGPAPYVSMQYLGRAVMSMLGVAMLALDGEGGKRLATMFQILDRALPITSGRHLYLASHALILQPVGREAELKVALDKALAYVQKHRSRDMRESERADLVVGLMTAAGIAECYRVGSEAFAHADALDRMGTQLASAAANRIRFLYHTLRGTRDEAEKYRRMLDVHAIQGGTTWQMEWFTLPVEGMSGARFGDLVTARRCLEQLERLSREVPSLTGVRDLLRMHYYYRRGDLEKAARLGEEFVSKYPPRTLIAWAVGHAVYAATLNDLRRHAEAKELCERTLRFVTEADHEYGCLYSHLYTELAVACGALGDVERFEDVSGRNLARLEQAREWAWLSIEYEHRARVAHVRGDFAALKAALKGMRDAAKRSNSPAMMAHAARRAASYLRAAAGSEPPAAGANGLSSDFHSPSLVSSGGGVNTPVRGFTRGKSHNMLHRAMKAADASSASLFVLASDELRLNASAGDEELPADVVEQAHSWLRARADDTPYPSGARSKTLNVGGYTYELLILPRRTRRAPLVLLVLGRESEQPGCDLPHDMLEKLTDWCTA